MITKISIIGKLENGETRTASIAVKNRRFDRRAVNRLLEKDEMYIEKMLDRFITLEICLELRGSQWTKPLKEKFMIEEIGSMEEKVDTILTLLMIVNYEMEMGRFRNCSL